VVVGGKIKSLSHDIKASGGGLSNLSRGFSHFYPSLWPPVSCQESYCHLTLFQHTRLDARFSALIHASTAHGLTQKKRILN